jgi:ribosomal protein S18 acetylase RimI-like enzyme
MTITYRDAAVADARMVKRLFRSSFIDTFAHLYEPKDLAAFLGKFTVSAWEGELSDPALAIRLAEEAGEPVGFAKIGPLSVPYETEAPAMELRQLYILLPWKGQGIAAALIEWALAEMRSRGAEEAFLSVYSDNHRAIRFYGRYGFEEVGAYHFMVGKQADDERIMRLRLEDEVGG